MYNKTPNSPSSIYVYSDKGYDENYDIIFNKLDDEIELVLPDDFNEPLNENSFPENLTSLVFGKYYNQVLTKETLPKNLKYLVLGDSFNKKINPNDLPDTLISLTLGKYFNQYLEVGSLPKSLLYLKIGEKFNKDILEKVLPDGLITLEFDKFSCFQKKIKKNILPNSIKKLVFGDEFNQKIKPNRLPAELKYFILGREYFHDLNNVLPDKVKYLEVGLKFIHRLINIPSSLEIICFDRFDYRKVESKTIKKIIIKNLLNGRKNIEFPDNLEEVQLIKYKLNPEYPLNLNCNLINEYGDIINL